MGVLSMVLGISTQTLAAGFMTCKVSLAKANAAGLMPLENDITLNIARIQSSNFELNKCSKTEVKEHNLTLSLCATEDTEAIGIFSAGVIVTDSGAKELQFASASQLMATPRASGRPLVFLRGESTLTDSFKAKMEAAGLEFPQYSGGDSLAIDDAVKNAFAKGVLTEKDIVSVGITDCFIK